MWTNAAHSRFYTWDALHGEIAVFDKRGYHLQMLDAVTGAHIKRALTPREYDSWVRDPAELPAIIAAHAARPRGKAWNPARGGSFGGVLYAS